MPVPSDQPDPGFPSDDQTADAILRTADNVNFYVHRVILAHASPFFRTIFNLPQPPQSCSDANETLPTIDVEESSQTLRILLTICYPFVKPKSYTLEEMEPAIRAALKYDMALPTSIFMENLCISAIHNPLQVWAIACRSGIERVARLAAESLLKINRPLENLDATLLNGVSAGDYFRLRQFLRKNGAVKDGFSLLKSPVNERVGTPDKPAFSATVPYADMFCRSSDGEEIPAHRAILAMSSPLLRQRIASVEVSNDGTSSGCVLEFDEAGPFLRLLLETCYRGTLDHVPSRPATFADLMLAAKKHQIEAIPALLNTQWTKVVKSNPLGAYFEAVTAGQKAWAKIAAQRLLDNYLHTMYDSSMEGASARSYHQLLQYYDACSAAVDRVVHQVRSEWPRDTFAAQSVALSKALSSFCQTALQEHAKPPGEPLPREHRQTPRTNDTPPDPLWCPSDFFDNESVFWEMSTPHSSVAVAQSVSNHYIQWRTRSTTRSQSRREAVKVLDLAHTLPRRLEDAVERVCHNPLVCTGYLQWIDADVLLALTGAAQDMMRNEMCVNVWLPTAWSPVSSMFLRYRVPLNLF